MNYTSVWNYGGKEAKIKSKYAEESESKVIWKIWLYTKKEANKSLKQIDNYTDYFALKEEEKAKYGGDYAYNRSRLADDYLIKYTGDINEIIKFLIPKITYKKHISILNDLETITKNVAIDVINDCVVEDYSEEKTIYRYDLNEAKANELEENYLMQMEFLIQYVEKITKKLVKIIEENNVKIFYTY